MNCTLAESSITGDTTPPPVDSNNDSKRKSWTLPVIIVSVLVVAIIAVILLFRVLAQARVYKYDSLSVDASALSDDDSWGYLGSELAEALLGSILKDSYVEIEANKNITVLIPDMGYRIIKADELATNMDGVDYSIEKDFIYMSSAGVTIVFKRIPKEEIGIYNKLLESATEITDESFNDMIDMAG